MPSQKNSGNRSYTFAINEIANNSGMSCYKTMVHIIFSKATTRTSCEDSMTWIGFDGQVGNSSTRAMGYIFFALRRLGQFRPQGFLTITDERTGSGHDVCSRLLSQSIGIDERFLYGY